MTPTKARNRALPVTLVAMAALLSGSCGSRSYRGAPHYYSHAPISRSAPMLARTAPAAEQAAGAVVASKQTDESERDSTRRFNTEAYARIYENPFLKVQDNPLSTFSVDVDTASYSNTRRFLSDGQLPPPDAVRLEELINYFGYSYPDPRGDAPFSTTAEVSACPWNRAHRLVHIGLQGKHIDPVQVPPRNLVFLLDVSGSMGTPRKLPLLKAALGLLVEQLREQDRVAMVVYAGASGLVLAPTPGSQRKKILSALDRLESGGSTNGGDGIRLAYRVARQSFTPKSINRVILATDGDFNVGTTSQGDLVRLIEKEREHGVFLTVLGLGLGNYKDSTMEQLADKGNGNYAYLDSLAEARKVLVREAGSTLVTIAKDVKIQVEFNPSRVRAFRLLGYENRMLRAEDFNDDRKDAGEIGAGHTVTALYEIVPAGAGVKTRLPGVDPLRYQTTRRLSGEANSGELLTLKLRYKQPMGKHSRLLRTPVLDRGTALSRSSDNFRFSAAVAAFGMLLRRSSHRADASFEMVRELARGARGQDPHGYRGEFLELVDRASRLAGARAQAD